MPKRVKFTSMHRTARHVRRQSHTINHLRYKVTLCILVVLVVVWGAYAYIQDRRMTQRQDGVEVVVGTTLMARIELNQDGEGMPVLKALEEVSVYPTSLQTIIITGEDLRVEVVAKDAQGYRLALSGGEPCLEDENGERLGGVARVYLPTGPESLQSPQ